MRSKSVIFGLILALLGLVSCQPGLLDNLTPGTGAEPAEGSGNVRVAVSLIPSYLAKTLGIAPASLPASGKAYMIANRVVFKLWMGANPMGELEVVPPATGSQPGISETNWTVLSGSGYHLTADVYNNNVDPNNPVVSGTSEPFDVIASADPADATQVWIRPIPNAPTAIASAGVPVSDTLLSCYDTGTTEPMFIGPGPDGEEGTADDTYVEYAIYVWGAERWFQITPGVLGAFRVNVTPDANSGVYFIVADSQGYHKLNGFNGFMSSDYQMHWIYGSPASAALLAPDSTYYVGLITVSNQINTSITSTVSVSFVEQLDDAYEPNDTLLTAAPVAKAAVVDGIDLDPVYGSDPQSGGDWYKFTMDAVGATNASIRIVFNNDESNLKLELWDYDPGTSMATHMQTADDSISSYPVTGIAETLEQEQIDATLVLSHTYYIWIGSSSGDLGMTATNGAGYQLQWQAGTGTITIGLE